MPYCMVIITDSLNYSFTNPNAPHCIHLLDRVGLPSPIATALARCASLAALSCQVTAILLVQLKFSNKFKHLVPIPELLLQR